MTTHELRAGGKVIASAAVPDGSRWDWTPAEWPRGPVEVWRDGEYVLTIPAAGCTEPDE